MLIGTYYHSLDVKGRVNFPAKLREALGERFIITRGLDGCLFVYPLADWEVLKEKLNALPMSKARNMQRFFFSGAVEAEPDKQGRVSIPQPLRDNAKLEKEVVIIGASTRAEIWDKDLWEQNTLEISDESVMETMDELGF